MLRDGVVPSDRDVTVQYQDAAGRLLRVGWEYSTSDKWAVLAVYAPAVAADRAQFFMEGYYEALE